MKEINIKTAIALVVASSLASCSGVNALGGLGSSEYGAIRITADKEGMRAFTDGLHGLITGAKATPDIKDGHHQLREQQEKEITIREAYKQLPSTNPFAKFLNGNKGE